MKFVLATVVVWVSSAIAFAAPGQPPDVAANAKRAGKVVVAVVEDVQSRFATNEFGDRLIVSQVWLRVEETLKGTHQGLVPFDLEGGTVGELRLQVSDLPVLRKGDRGVFMLDEVSAGGNKPHSRGDGILKLDQSDRVSGTDVRLADIKAALKASQK